MANPKLQDGTDENGGVVHFYTLPDGTDVVVAEEDVAALEAIDHEGAKLGALRNYKHPENADGGENRETRIEAGGPGKDAQQGNP